MNMLKTITATLAMAGVVATGQEAYQPHPDWENPENLSQGREDARAFFVPFANKEEALKGKRKDSSLVISLSRLTVIGNFTGRPHRLSVPSIFINRRQTSAAGQR